MQPIDDTTDQEQAFSNGYKKAYEKLLADNWQPRKARLYLNSIAKRNFRKSMKGIRKHQATNSVLYEEPIDKPIEDVVE